MAKENTDGSVKTLVRGLQLLTALNDVRTATISGLVRDTDLPKATVVRLVKTLISCGYVEETREPEGYRVTPKVRQLARGRLLDSPIFSVVHPMLEKLSGIIKWPAEFLVRDGYSMVIEASNRGIAPIKVGSFEGRRFPIAKSATGIAYLSAMSKQERLKTIESSVARIDPAQNATEQERMISNAVDATELALQNGFSKWNYDDLEEGMRSIGVPVISGAGPVGAISVFYFETAMSDEQLSTTILPAINEVRGRIAEAFPQ